MFGYDTFGTSIFHGETFGVETEVLPCLKDIFQEGHEFFTELSFPGGGGNTTYPTTNSLLIDGDVEGKSLRIIPAEGYEIHWLDSDGDNQHEWVGGLGKLFNQNDAVPITYTAQKMVEKSTGKEYTFGPCSSTSGNGTDPDAVYGCMATNATNYDQTVTEDNGSCICEEGFELNDDDTECVEEASGMSDIIKYSLYGGVGLAVLMMMARR